MKLRCRSDDLDEKEMQAGAWPVVRNSSLVLSLSPVFQKLGVELFVGATSVRVHGG